MTRDELIEIMATVVHVMRSRADLHSSNDIAAAVLASIEAQGLAIVPVEAMDAMENAGWNAEGLQTPDRVWNAMIAAGRI